MTGTITFKLGAPEERHFVRIRLELGPIDHQNRCFQSFVILNTQINLMAQLFNESLSADR